MPEYVKRMMEEQTELYERIRKLRTFIDSPKYRTMTNEKQILINYQFDAMNMYYYFLTERLELEAKG